MESFFRGVIHFRYVVITLVGACTLLAGLQIRHLPFENDTDSIIPLDDPVRHNNDLVRDRFGMWDPIIIGVINENPAENGVFNPRTLRLVKELSERIALLPGVRAVRDEDVASIATVDNISGTADGLVVAPFMEHVPTTPDALTGLKNTILSNSLYVDWLVSQDGSGLLISAKMEPAGGTQEGFARRAAVYTKIHNMVQAKRDAGVPEELYIAGRGAMDVTFSADMRQDMARFLPLVFAVVLSTLYLTYRSLRGVVLPLTVVIVSVIWTLGSMATLGVPIDLVSTMLPVILMAVGVADGIHILSRYYDALLEQPGLTAPDAVTLAMAEMWRPVVFTSLTTAAGFLSFLTASLVPVRNFGLFTAVGVVVAMILSLTLFPAALAVLPAKVSRSLRAQMDRSGDLATTGWAARILAGIGRGVARRPGLVWVSAGLVTIGCLIGTQRIVVDSSWIRIFHADSPIRKADQILRAKFQGTLSLYVTLEGHAPDLLKDPDLLRKLDRLQAEIEQDPAVGGSVSIAEYIKRMNRVMHADRPEMEVVPTSRELVAQYLLLYSFSGDPDDFDEVVDYDYQQANVSFALRSDSSQDAQRIVDQIQDFAEREFGRAAQNGTADQGLRERLFLRFGRWLSHIAPTITGWETNSDFRIGFAGRGYATIRTNELIVAGQVSSLVTSLVAVFLLTALMFRSVIAGVINMLPISLVIIMSFGLLGLLNIPLEIGKSMTASIVIGVGVDYAIHFLSRYQRKICDGLSDPEQITVATLTTSGKAIFFNALVVIGGFLVFLSSNFRPNFYLGAMLALNMGACLLVTLTVLPVLLNTFKPRFVYGREKICSARKQP